MGAIVLDLRPGTGIGPFSLGICQYAKHLQHQLNIYDVVHVKYFDEEPLKLDIIISFPDHGFHLHFDPWDYDLSKYMISNSSKCAMPLLSLAVYALFEQTFPGSYDKDIGVYTLFYPGLSFAFPIPSQYKDCCHDGEDKKVSVGSSRDNVTAPSLPFGSFYMEDVHVELGEELYFPVGGQHIPFVASPQDAWTELGRPCGIHQKQVDQMVIHSASDSRPRTTLCGDYFYNYFTRELDILFDGQKFVLHTNYRGHADFNSYIKCNFVIHSSDVEGSFKEVNYSKNKITLSSKWEQVKEFHGDSGRATIQPQGSMNNPFGSTFVYGYENIAFEVMKNGQIATVTRFQS